MNNDALAQLIAPLTAERFRAAYYERATLHVQQTAMSLPVQAADQARLIALTAHAHPARLRVNRAGQVLVPPRGARAEALQRWAMDAYEEGGTIVLNYIEALDPSCQTLATELGKSLHARVTFTAFITPAHAQGFAPHFDTLDVLVMQVDGVKEWHLGKTALHLPSLRQGYLVDAQQCMQQPHKRITLATGGVLYIPRGVVHWATTSAQPSMHITADIDTATLADVLIAALRTPELLSEPARALGARRLAQTSGQMTRELACVLASMGATRDLPTLCEVAQRTKWARLR